MTMNGISREEGKEFESLNVFEQRYCIAYISFVINRLYYTRDRSSYFSEYYTCTGTQYNIMNKCKFICFYFGFMKSIRYIKNMYNLLSAKDSQS